MERVLEVAPDLNPGEIRVGRDDAAIEIIGGKIGCKKCGGRLLDALPELA